MKSRNKHKGILLRNSKTTQTQQHQPKKYIYQESTLSTIASHQTLHASKNETYICKPSSIISTSKQFHPIQTKKHFNIHSPINSPHYSSNKKTPHFTYNQVPIKRSLKRQNSLSSSISVNSLTTTESISYKLKRSNSNISNQSGGTVNIISIPTKINNVNLNLYEHNSVIRFDIRKVILIQSVIRMYLLRKAVYMELMKGYKIQKGIYHIEKAFEINSAYLKWLAFYKINKDEEIKYYVNEEEYELLNELKKWKITSIDDYDTFTFWITGDE